MTEKMKTVLQILAIGSLCAFLLDIAGLHLLAIFSMGFIPFAFVCWGLSHVLAGSQGREISANLTVEERDDLNEMASEYGRRIGLQMAPVVVIAMVILYAAIAIFNPTPPSVPGDHAMQQQIQLLGGMLCAGAVAALSTVPGGIKQYRRTKEFLLQTEYARNKGYSP